MSMKDEPPSGANRDANKDVSGNIPALGMVSKLGRGCGLGGIHHP